MNNKLSNNAKNDLNNMLNMIHNRDNELNSFKGANNIIKEKMIKKNIKKRVSVGSFLSVEEHSRLEKILQEKSKAIGVREASISIGSLIKSLLLDYIEANEKK